MNSFLETPTNEIVNLANVFNIAVESDHDWTERGNDEYYVAHTHIFTFRGIG